MAQEPKQAGGLKHLGVIADGNRRWARERGLATIEGHKKGIDAIESMVEAAGKAGIEYITFYVFSTENWGRSKDEVGYIMKLVETQIMPYVKKLKAKNARFLVLGSRRKLSPKLVKILEEAEALTADCTGITVCFCFNYGGEQEIADAASAAILERLDDLDLDLTAEVSITREDLKNGKVDHPVEATFDIPDEELELSPDDIRKHLYHPEVPNVDLVVRTSGEQRISGFMLWRAAYAEFLFLDKYFPDMSGDDIADIIEEFENRNRRFGK